MYVRYNINKDRAVGAEKMKRKEGRARYCASEAEGGALQDPIDSLK